MLGADPSGDGLTVLEHGRLGGTRPIAVVTANNRTTLVHLERLGEAPDLRWRDQREPTTLDFKSLFPLHRMASDPPSRKNYVALCTKVDLGRVFLVHPFPFSKRDK